MSLLSSLTKAFNTYGDDTLKSIGKQLGNKLDDASTAESLWKGIGNAIENGNSGSQIRNSMKKAALSAIEAEDDIAAKSIMQNMPVVAHSSPHFDDLLSDKVGSYFQITPANNIEPFGALVDNRTFTSLIDPESAVKKSSDLYTKLVSPFDTGFSTGRGKTLQEWSDDLAREINGIADSKEIGSRNLLQDYIYENQGKNFALGDDMSYAELAMPRRQASNNLQKEIMDVGTGNSVADKMTRGDIISHFALDRIMKSKNKPAEFDKIFLGVAPVIGGGTVLSSLLGKQNERSQNG